MYYAKQLGIYTPEQFLFNEEAAVKYWHSNDENELFDRARANFL